jgi:hypothetical protein
VETLKQKQTVVEGWRGRRMLDLWYYWMLGLELEFGCWWHCSGREAP